MNKGLGTKAAYTDHKLSRSAHTYVNMCHGVTAPPLHLLVIPQGLVVPAVHLLQRRVSRRGDSFRTSEAQEKSGRRSHSTYEGVRGGTGRGMGSNYLCACISVVGEIRIRKRGMCHSSQRVCARVCARALWTPKYLHV